MDGPAREDSGQASGNERVNRTLPELNAPQLLIGHSAFFPMLESTRASRAGERALALMKLYSSRTDKREVLISPPNFIRTARWQTKHHRPADDCSANGSSYSACRDLELHFICSFIYVPLAIHRNPGGNLRPYCPCENSQVWRRDRRQRNCHRRAGLGLHRADAGNHGHPVTCEHDSVGSRTLASPCNRTKGNRFRRRQNQDHGPGHVDENARA